ncbi:hypothetical protein [Kordiimonas sp.]|uniref:hypothetical protein n=1 Tax=Kordiimonas sp. TaxID=1970157 RepID=UPI003A9345D2
MLRDVGLLLSVKYLSILLSMLTGLSQVYIFTKLIAPEDLAWLFTVSGAAAFLSLFDFGFGKPLYVALRKKFVNNDDMSRVYRASFSILFCFFLLSNVFFVAAFSVVSSQLEKISTLSFLLFTVSSGLNISVGLMKHVFYAVDKYLLFDLHDLVRRIINFASLIFFFYWQDFFSFACFQLCALAISIFLLIFQIKQPLCLKANVFELKPFKASAFKNLGFSFNELFIYSGGYIAFKISSHPLEFLKFVLWSKVYGIVVVFIRALTDVELHRVSREYMAEPSLGRSKQLVWRVIVISVLLALLASTFLFVFGEAIIEFVGNGAFVLSDWLIVSLTLMLIASSIQHPSGTVLVSVVGDYRFLLASSTAMSIAIFFVYLLARQFSMEKVLLTYSLVFFIGSAVYFFRSRYCLRTEVAGKHS